MLGPVWSFVVLGIAAMPGWSVLAVLACVRTPLHDGGDWPPNQVWLVGVSIGVVVSMPCRRLYFPKPASKHDTDESTIRRNRARRALGPINSSWTILLEHEEFSGARARDLRRQRGRGIGLHISRLSRRVCEAHGYRLVLKPSELGDCMPAFLELLTVAIGCTGGQHRSVAPIIDRCLIVEVDRGIVDQDKGSLNPKVTIVYNVRNSEIRVREGGSVVASDDGLKDIHFTNTHSFVGGKPGAQLAP